MTGRRAGPGATAAGLLIALGVIHLAGRGGLATPGLADPDGWAAWLGGREPVEVAFSIIRLIALGLTWYLLVALVVGVVLRFRGATLLVAAFDRITPAALRRVMAGVVVLGLTGPASAQVDPTTTTTTTEATGETVTMHRLLDGEAPPLSPVQPPAASPSPDPVPAPDTSSAAVPNSWTVTPGECFWTIADDVLAAAWGRPPSDAEVVPYWNRLIEANRHLLADPSNPDLIFPGQVLTVPVLP